MKKLKMEIKKDLEFILENEYYVKRENLEIRNILQKALSLIDELLSEEYKIRN
jgi:rRNA maturation protein Rpf1